MFFLPSAPEGCCNYPDELEGFWFWGVSKILAGTGRRSYYKDEVTTCELSETRQYDSPSDPPYTTGMLNLFFCLGMLNLFFLGMLNLAGS